MAFNGLEIGKRSIQAHQTAIDVTGHNISNANTKGYSRQVADIEAKYYADSKYGTMGIGADVESVKRVRNSFIDDRLLKETSEKNKWDTREINLKHLQYVFNEPSDKNLRTILDEYWNALQDLSQNPEDRSIRINLKERASDLTNTINNTYERISLLRKNVNDNIQVVVNDINSTLKQMADVNKQINKLEINGQKANDLRDKFDLLAEKLSENVNVKIERSGNKLSVLIGGRVAVQGEEFKKIMVDGNPKVNEGMFKIKWEDTKEDIYLTNGRLQALSELRDDDIVRYLDYLDELSIGLIDNMNDIHKSGFDLNKKKGENFFGNFATESEETDLNNDGIKELLVYKIRGEKVINKIEEPLSKTEGFEAEKGKIDINGRTIIYDTTKDSLKDIVERINTSKAGIVASIDPNNKLVLRAQKEEGYMLKNISQEEGKLLNDLGIFGKLEYDPKTNELISQPSKFDYRYAETLKNISLDRTATPKKGAAKDIFFAIDNVDRIAAAQGVDTDGDDIADVSNNSGDGSNALRLAEMKYKAAIGKHTFSEYFKSLITDLGVSAQEATRVLSNQELLIHNLEQRRQSEIGVSLDEEMANMIRYQHGYDAAAKYIQTVNQMLDTVINKL